MATIQNDRDVLLQAATTRVIPVPIPISQVEGLETELDNINTSITNQGTMITSVMNNTKDLSITASRTVFSGSSGTITLTAVFKNDLTGTATWSVTAGSATLVPSGNTCTVSGNTVSGSAVTIRARVTVSGKNYDSFITLSKLGTLSAQDSVDLNTQVTGQLATGKITGLGALALLNVVDLNTQTVGALNGQTQVTNLGTLAYANSIAANQIGAGTLAAGVIYAGAINADNITSGTLTGRTIRTSAAGRRVVIDSVDNAYKQYDSDSYNFVIFDETGSVFKPGKFANNALSVSGYGKIGAYCTSNTYAVYAEGSIAGILAVSQLNTGIECYGVIRDIDCTGSGVIRLKSRSTLPTVEPGLVAYHSTHGFIFCNGSGWYTPSNWTQVT